MTESAPTEPQATAATSRGDVPLMAPMRVYEQWGRQAEEGVIRTLRSHAYVKGADVAALETEFAARVGAARAVAVDSGTDALYLTLRAVLEDRPADRREVILPTFTFVATAGAVVNAGGIPVFADVLEDTMNLDPASVDAHLSERTAAVIPVHLFGAIADMDGIREAVGPDLFVLEDAAQAVDATLKGRGAGAIGDAGTFSFYPSKNLGAAGDGGMVTTNDPALADLVAALRDHGQTRKMYDHAWIGTNSRMDTIQAVVLRAKLPHLGGWTRARRAIGVRYDQAFAGTACRAQASLPDSEHAYHLYTVRVPERDALRASLAEAGIAAGVYYPMPLHRQTCFARFGPAPCPVADGLAECVLSLPCFPGLTRPEQDRVIDAVRAALPA